MIKAPIIALRSLPLSYEGLKLPNKDIDVIRDVVYNHTAQDIEINLPEGNWEIVINSQSAEIESLEQVKGSLVNIVDKGV